MEISRNGVKEKWRKGTEEELSQNSISQHICNKSFQLNVISLDATQIVNKKTVKQGIATQKKQ